MMSCSAIKTEGKKKQGVTSVLNGICLPKQLLHISCFLPILQWRRVRERLGGYLAAGWDQLTINNKFLEMEWKRGLSEILFTFPQSFKERTNCSPLQQQLRIMPSCFLNEVIRIQFQTDSVSNTFQQSSPVSRKGVADININVFLCVLRNKYMQVSHCCTNSSTSQIPQNPIYNWKTEIYSTNHPINASITDSSSHDHLLLWYDQFMIKIQTCNIRFSLFFRPNFQHTFGQARATDGSE